MKPHQILLFILGLIIGAAPVRALNAGQPAPDFTLTDLEGRSQSLAAYRGRVVVLEWHNPDCPIVHKHYDSGNLPQTQRAATAEGVVWLCINSGAPGQQGADYSPAELKTYLAKAGATPTAYLRDPQGTVGRSYGAKTTPHLFIINEQGTLVYHGAIDSIRSSRIADIAQATNYVRAALGDLKAGRPVSVPSTQPYGCSVHY